MKFAKRFFSIFVLFSVLFCLKLSAQTFPEACCLNSLKFYSLTEWKADSPAKTYPPNMIFHTCKSADPKIEDEATGDYNVAYNLTSKARINGLDSLGFSFASTSSTNSGCGFPNAAVLALNTSHCSNIQLAWTGRTISNGAKTFSISLQYRIPNDTLYKTLGEYKSNDKNGHSENFNLTLPADCENKPLIYLRWKYHHTGGESGRRPELGVDDIKIDALSTSVFDNSNEELNVYPNPVRNNMLNILVSMDQEIFNNLYNIRLIDIFGNEIFKLNDISADGNLISIDLSKYKLINNIYYLYLESPHFKKYTKVLVIK